MKVLFGKWRKGAVLIPTSRYVPDPKQKEALLKDAMADYEKVYEIQKPYFDKLGTHPRGELLFGLAEGWRRLGDEKKARGYLEQIVQTCKATPYEAEAREWLQKEPAAGAFLPVHHGHIFSRKIFDTLDALRITPGGHDAFLPNRKGNDSHRFLRKYPRNFGKV